MKNYKGLKELVCFLICYILVVPSFPVKAIMVSNSNDTAINNGSLLVKEGDWLYYRNSSDGGSIYKIKTDGTQNTKINDISSCNINVSGDWIYFKSLSSDKYYEMYRIEKDGSKLQDLNFKSNGEKIIGDYIYYYSKQYSLNKVKIDGTENENLVESQSGSNPNEFMAGGYIYYNKYVKGVGFQMFRCKLDDGNEMQVFSDVTNGNIIKVTDNWIYIKQYENTSGITSLYRLKPDGSQKSKIGDGNIFDITIINDDWIYNYKENCFKKMDGSNVINESDVMMSDIPMAIINDRIYYHKNDGGFYALKTDGTEKLKIYTSPSKEIHDYDYDCHLFSCINDGNYIYYINDYNYGEKFLYKFDINSSTSKKLTPDESIQKVSKDKQWTIKFSKKFDVNTINDKNILITDGDNVPIKMSITPNADGNSITLSKVAKTSWDNPYWDNVIKSYMRGGKQIYNIKITQNVKDADGHNLKDYAGKKFEITE